MALAHKWFGTGCDDSDELRGEALWLETQYWQNMEAVVNNGIVKSFKGS